MLTRFQGEQIMTPSIAHKCATTAVLLAVSCLVGACSSSPREETTGSLSQPQAQVGSATPLPPVIDAPSTVAANQPAQPYAQPYAQPVAYAPRPAVYAPRPVAYAPRAKTCTCPALRRYDVTASIPRTRPAAPAPIRPAKMQFIVHTIGPHETLYSISRLYRTRVSDLATVNRMAENSQLRYGELLVVPTAAH
jgi:membrane-bound lytic murein transglycosylase D